CTDHATETKRLHLRIGRSKKCRERAAEINLAVGETARQVKESRADCRAKASPDRSVPVNRGSCTGDIPRDPGWEVIPQSGVRRSVEVRRLKIGLEPVKKRSMMPIVTGDCAGKPAGRAFRAWRLAREAQYGLRRRLSARK